MTASRTYTARMDGHPSDRRAWTEHDDARLFDLVAEGLSSAAIGRVHRRGLKFAIAPIGGPKRLRKHPEAPRAAPKPHLRCILVQHRSPRRWPHTSLSLHCGRRLFTAMRERAEVIVKRGRPAR